MALGFLWGAPLRAQQEGKAHLPLTVHEIVSNLEQRDQARAQALHRFEGTRVYSLHYRGFPHNYDAEMVVNLSYESPARKEFTVVSQSGSKFIVERVFKKMLESEKEAGKDQSRTALSEQNYEFALVGHEENPEGGRYILSVTPKSKNKFLYRGKVWIDAADFAVVKIEGGDFFDDLRAARSIGRSRRKVQGLTEAPSSKHQAPEKHQAPSSTSREARI